MVQYQRLLHIPLFTLFQFGCTFLFSHRIAYVQTVNIMLDFLSIRHF